MITLGLSFTGYLLPWDQLAYWAITIGSNIANSPREVTDAIGITKCSIPGGFQKRLLLGANYVGQEALIRFYVLHIAVLRWRSPHSSACTSGASAKMGAWPSGKNRPARPPNGAENSDPYSAAGHKTYGLMALVKGKRPPVNRGPENTV